MASRQRCPAKEIVSQRSVRLAHQQLLDGSWGVGPQELHGLRDVVFTSWQRSLAHLPRPEQVRAPLVWSEDEVRANRARHPLAAVLPVVQRLLVEPSVDTGIVVVVGDERGRILWVDGDRSMMRRTDQLLLTPGADWSENAMGTSAPGTALVVGGGVQIVGAEHFVPAVQLWNCTAVPIHDPAGKILGVIDVTGGRDAVGPRSMAWVRAAVGAVEAELRLASQMTRPSGRPGVIHVGAALVSADPAGRSPAASGSATAGPAAPETGEEPRVSVLGCRAGRFRAAGADVTLSLRHAEILTLLAVHPAGLSGEELVELLDPRLSAITLRAEMSRLRRFLVGAGLPQWCPASRPYCLPGPVTVDAEGVYALVAQGKLEQAVARYAGPVLPGSEAPGIARLRHKVAAALREAILGDGSLPVVLAYLELPETREDVEAWMCALRLLPRTSPRRAVIVAHLEQVEKDLG